MPWRQRTELRTLPGVVSPEGDTAAQIAVAASETLAAIVCLQVDNGHLSSVVCSCQEGASCINCHLIYLIRVVSVTLCHWSFSTLAYLSWRQLRFSISSWEYTGAIGVGYSNFILDMQCTLNDHSWTPDCDQRPRADLWAYLSQVECKNSVLCAAVESVAVQRRECDGWHGNISRSNSNAVCQFTNADVKKAYCTVL